jgi:glycine/D-amino acid oxidase-like deaminating enzyme
METFKKITADIDCDPQPGGHLYIAHKAKAMPALEKEAKVMREIFHYDARILDADTVRREYVDDKEAAGALHEPEGIGIHAGKLAFGYLRKARALGAKVHPSSPVMGWETRNGVHYLQRRAAWCAPAPWRGHGRLHLAHLHPQVKNRLLPILSNSLVTRPLTPAEIEACNFRTHQVITDTRTCATTTACCRTTACRSAAAAPSRAPMRRKVYKQGLINDLHRKFPALTGIGIDYSWWGWVDVSHDMMPRIVQPDPKQSIFYSLGYGGNGVMYSAQAGGAWPSASPARPATRACRSSIRNCRIPT